jgi:outer membrane receptor protein involved in Fe transport
MKTRGAGAPAAQRVSVVAVALAMACGSHFTAAQEAPATTTASTTELAEVTVTGSRLRRTDGMAEPTPVTTLSPVELQIFEPGATVAEQLDGLPQFFSTGSAERGGAALFGDGGGSYLNMRGLGRNRTLVLFDGSRIVPSDKLGQVNVDTLPTALVRSVDVVTGGASAAYGADALGGVTNFILDREFEGLKFSASTGMNEYKSSGKNWNASLAGGTKIGDRINVIGSIEGRHVNQVSFAPEDFPDWFQRWGYIQNPAWSASDPPGTNPRRVTVPWVAPAGVDVNGLIAPPFGVPASSALANQRFTDDGSALVPLDRGTLYDSSFMSGSSDALRSNETQPGGPGGSEVKQVTAFLSGTMAVTDSVSVFADILLGSVQSNGFPHTSGATLSSIWSPTVFRENAYLPASVGAIMDTEGRSSFRIAKAGSYYDTLDIDTTGEARNKFETRSFRLGFDWAVNDNWDLRTSWQKGRSKKWTGEYGALRVDRLLLAIDAVEVYDDMRDVNTDGIIDLVDTADRGTGTIVCNVQRYDPTPAELASTPAIQGQVSSRDINLPLASPIGLDDTVSDCVPFNIMGNQQISPEAEAYIHTTKYGLGQVDQDFAEALLTGELSEGWGAGAVSLATGLTYRKQSFSDGAFPVDVDTLGPPFNAPELGIRGVASAWSSGSPNLHQFSTVSLLSGNYNVWEVFGELNVPIWKSASGAQHLGSSFAFRRSDYSSSGSINAWKIGLDFQVLQDLRLRATQSRDVREASFSERFDDGPGGGTITLDDETGDTNVAITSTSAGNPNLKPERADTTVLGIVYTPRWLDGLRMSVDTYQVKIKDSIATLADDDVVDECYDNNVLCEYVFRDTTGHLTRVLRPYLNLDQAKVEGTDFEVDFRRPVNFFGGQSESFSIRALGGVLHSRTNTVAGSVPDELAGSRSLVTLPKLTASLSATYNIGPWSAQLQDQFVGKVNLNRTWVEGVDIDDNWIGSQSTVNLMVGYRHEVEGRGTWRVTFNIQNLLDRDPPIIPNATDGRFGAQAVDYTYDNFGRRYQLGFSMDL